MRSTASACRPGPSSISRSTDRASASPSRPCTYGSHQGQEGGVWLAVGDGLVLAVSTWKASWLIMLVYMITFTRTPAAWQARTSASAEAKRPT